MKQIFINKKAFVEEVPAPTPGVNEVLVQVSFSLISTGTETRSLLNSKENNLSKKIDIKKQQFNKLKNNLLNEGIGATFNKVKSKVSPSSFDKKLVSRGYSNAGIIISKGQNVKDFNVGDKVACGGSGIAAHAEFVSVPVNLVSKIPENVSMKNASFTTVASIAVQGLRRSDNKPGEIILVVGLGLIGLITVQIAKAWGMIVIAADIKQDRIEKSKLFGADLSLNFKDKDFDNQVMKLTSQYGVDSVLITAATKSSDPANRGLKLCKKRGKVVVVGDVGMDLQRSSMYKNELDFLISTSYGPGRYDAKYEIDGCDYPYGYVRWTENRNMQEVLRLLSDKKIDFDKLVSEIYPVEEAEKAFESLINSQNNNIGVLIFYSNEEKIVTYSNKLDISNEIVEGKINVGLIGAGSFAFRVHLPNIIKNSEYYNLRAICSRNSSNLKIYGEKFKANYISTDYNELLNDSKISLIVITTKHDIHGKLVIEALEKGKNVLVEKPLAIKKGEIVEIKKILKKCKQQLFVGFNRRYSPFIIKTKDYILNKRDPLFINYRINAGYLRSDHWTQRPNEGGGRVIGEVCHFIDLCNYLVNSDIVVVNSVNIPSDVKKEISDDNYSIQIQYANGSIASINYICNGSKEVEKELLEISSGKSTIIINNFREMNIYDLESKRVKIDKVDKGHENQIVEIAKALKNKNNLIPDTTLDLISSEMAIKIAGR